jgi:hypothetical protein
LIGRSRRSELKDKDKEMEVHAVATEANVFEGNKVQSDWSLVEVVDDGYHCVALTDIEKRLCVRLRE